MKRVRIRGRSNRIRRSEWIRGEFKITIAGRDDRSPLTCSLSRCPRRRGGCRSLRGGSGGGSGGCCPTNWNWPSHRSYSRSAPGPEDGPSPENDARPSRSIVSSQKLSSIAARRALAGPVARVYRVTSSPVSRAHFVIPARAPSSFSSSPPSSPSPSPASSRRTAAPR